VRLNEQIELMAEDLQSIEEERDYLKTHIVQQHE
jgi:hypothetical protein